MMVLRFTAGTGSMARWLPIGLFPLLCGQYYSDAGGVDLGALFYTFRKREKKGPLGRRKLVDFSYP